MLGRPAKVEKTRILRLPLPCLAPLDVRLDRLGIAISEAQIGGMLPPLPAQGSVMSQRASSIPQRRTVRPLFESFEEALACHQQGRLSEAERLYETVLEADERHFGSVNGLGLVRLQQGRFAEAMLLFRRATKIDRNCAEAHHHLAVALTGLGRPEEAIERFEKALAIRPDFAEAHDSLGHALQLLGRHEATVPHHEQAIAIKPGYAEARNNLGNALHRLGRSEKAIPQYEKALAIRPDYARIPPRRLGERLHESANEWRAERMARR